MAEVYMITTTESDKKYIGKTNRSSSSRFREHKNTFECRAAEHRPLYSAMKKHGVDTFSYKVLAIGLSSEEADALEIDLIHQHGTFNYGYNATVGGDGSTYRLVSDKDISYIVDLYLKEGLSIWDIAPIMGVSRETVSDRLRGAGIDTSSGPSFYNRPITAISKNGQKISFKTGNELIDYLHLNNFTSAEAKRISEGVNRVLKGMRKSYLTFTYER